MEKRVQKSNDLVSTGCFETSSAKLLLCQVVVWQVPDMASVKFSRSLLSFNRSVT